MFMESTKNFFKMENISSFLCLLCVVLLTLFYLIVVNVFTLSKLQELLEIIQSCGAGNLSTNFHFLSLQVDTD